MSEHLIDGEFQSDKYPTTPRGLVPLSTKDPMAQDLLAEYARRRRAAGHPDVAFSEDLDEALRLKGFGTELVLAKASQVLEIASASVQLFGEGD